VDVGRHPQRAVPEHLGDHSEFNALGEHDGRGGMLWVVETQACKTSPSYERLKASCNAARREGTPIRAREDTIIFQPSTARSESHFCLGPALMMEGPIANSGSWIVRLERSILGATSR
jgi:hypothetical protein